MNVTIVLPSLDPDEKLNLVVDGLIEKGFKDIVIVNDGSHDDHLEPFEKAAQHKEVTVLTHEVNKGKGRGLKTAFQYVLENRPDSEGVITVDGDNQHTPKDILKCAERMIAEKDKVVLGCRDFDEPNVPPKSRFGNKTTSRVFRIFCGMKISDTQTGLRAIPRQYLELLVKTKGERFEYETEMFFALHKSKIEWVEEKIETVYIEENASTHFNPFLDSIKIYRIILKFIFKYTLSSLICCVLDIGLYSLLIALSQGSVNAGSMSLEVQMLAATIIARVLSSIVNYILNQKAVFQSNASMKKTVWKYYLLACVQAALAYGGVYLIALLFGPETIVAKFIAKPVVDVILFLGSYQIQQRWVFRG